MTGPERLLFSFNLLKYCCYLGAISTRGKVVFSGEFGLLTRVVVVVVVVDRAYMGGMITFDIFRLGAGGSGRKVEVG